MDFAGSPRPTIGVEMELQLVDRTTGALVPLASTLIDEFGELPWLKSELLQSTIEINTGICEDISDYFG